MNRWTLGYLMLFIISVSMLVICKLTGNTSGVWSNGFNIIATFILTLFYYEDKS